ncbi:MAG: hypothetical protein HYY78_22035 [Betaproteobacteria bacterium]|nr:hypothetical protein [Betaproteobacteria bacterium]
MSETTAHHADAAWVTIEVPLERAALAAFCRDVERLYRINPYLEFRRWRETAPGAFTVSMRNLSNQRDFELQLTLERASERDFSVRYDQGLKRSTRFEIDATDGGSRLRITDDYSGALETDTAEVDRSLHAWGVALREYLLRDRRWGWCAPWRWYMRRVWVPMKPSARRITFIILLVTLAEVVLFALVMAIYWAEHRA